MFEINWHPSRRELRQFAVILGAFSIVLGALVWYKIRELSITVVIWTVGFLVALVGYNIPPFMRWVFVGWMVAAYPIGWTISHLLMAVIFYFVLTPIGFLVRLINSDPMQRQFDRTAKTYWTRHDPGRAARRYFKQY